MLLSNIILSHVSVFLSRFHGGRTKPPQDKTHSDKTPHFLAWVGQNPHPIHSIILDFYFCFVTHDVPLK